MSPKEDIWIWPISKHILRIDHFIVRFLLVYPIAVGAVMVQPTQDFAVHLAIFALPLSLLGGESGSRLEV